MRVPFFLGHPVQHASKFSRGRQYFLAELMKISLKVNALFYSFETVIFI